MKIRIRNFQSLALVELDVQGLTVILGPSDIGKSALIRAVASAFYGRPGDDFIRWGASETSVEIVGAPKVNGGTIDIGWFKGEGVNKFVVDGRTYDKVARDTPVHVQDAGYREVSIGNEDIRPQVAGQFDRIFLLDRPGSFVHDVIAEASRLSVLLRADKNCSTDLKRQRSIQKLRQTDLEEAKTRLESMANIREFHGRVTGLKIKLSNLKGLSKQVDNIKSIAETRKHLLPLQKVEIPKPVEYASEAFNLGPKIEEVKKLAAERKAYLGLPENVPSNKPIDLEGLISLDRKLDEARGLGLERKRVYREKLDAHSSLSAIIQEGEIAQASLDEALSTLKICPVCDRPMEDVNAQVHTH